MRLLQSLDHPNIIKYLDSFLHGTELVIVVEWAAAGDLKRQLRKAQEVGVEVTDAFPHGRRSASVLLCSFRDGLTRLMPFRLLDDGR